jgi:hypothetical protein
MKKMFLFLTLVFILTGVSYSQEKPEGEKMKQWFFCDVIQR